MKFLRIIIGLIIVIAVLGVIGFNKVNVEVVESDLPESVYGENSNLLYIANSRLIGLFILQNVNEYTVVEEVINLVILDTIRKNINSEYDPLGNCETDECNYIFQGDTYYINYAWAELSENDQLIIHISVGSDKFIHVNTIIDFYLDIDINYMKFEISLTLDKLFINEMGLSIENLDRLLRNLDKDAIEETVTKGELDMENYKYDLSFSILP